MNQKEKDRLAQHYYHANRIKSELNKIKNEFERDEQVTRSQLVECMSDGETFITGNLLTKRVGPHISVVETQ